MNFILATTQTRGLTGERAKLWGAIVSAGHECWVVNPNRLLYSYPRGGDFTTLGVDPYSGVLSDYSGVNFLIARGTSGCRPAAYLLASSLHFLASCDIVDPLERYQCDVGKMATTVKNHNNDTGIDTWCVFSDVGLDLVINDLPYPVIVKPHDGSHGKNIAIIDTPSLLRHHCMDLLSRSANYPVYIQRYMKFDHEYRVMCVDGEVIGVVERERLTGDFMRSKRTPVDVKIPQHIIPDGIVGLDVGVIDNDFYVIEENYAPEWSSFEDKTNINVAKLIVAKLQEVDNP